MSSHEAFIGNQRAVLSRGRDSHWMVFVCSIFGVGLTIGAASAITAGITELGFILLSFAVMAWFAWWVLRQWLYSDALVVIMFLGGYAISWGVGFLGYRYLLLDHAVAMGLPSEHTKTTALLVLVSVLATVVGALFPLIFCSRSERNFPSSGHRGAVLRVLPVFAIVYLVFQAASLQVLGLNSRSEIGNYHQIGSTSYLVSGFQMISYPFYALLGMSLRLKIFSVWNLAVGAFMALVIGLQSLTGGRTTALEPLVVFFLGAIFSVVPWRRIAFLSAASVPLVIFLMVVIGIARGTGGFSGGTIGDKVTAITTVVMEGRSEGSQYDDPLFVLFSRLFETSGQTVIDNAAETGNRVGFINIERLLFVFVPRFAYPEKAPLDDSNERLAADYGYAINEYSSAPLTLLADSYERFGVLGVVLFHVIAGVLLGIVGALICRARDRVLSLVVLVCCGRTALLLYAASALGFFHLVFYALLRDILVISLCYYSAVFVSKLLKLGRCPYGLQCQS